MKGQLVIPLVILIFIQIFCLSSSSPSTGPAAVSKDHPRRPPPSKIRRQGQQKTDDEANVGGGGGGGHRIRHRRSVNSASSNPHPPLEYIEDVDTPSVRVHVVKNADFDRWRRSQGPDAILTRHPLAPSVLMMTHRYPRVFPVVGGDGDPGDQVAASAEVVEGDATSVLRSKKGIKSRGLVGRQSGPGGDGSGGGGGANGNTEKPHVVTPVLPINGDKKFNETDCMPWEYVAILLRSSMHPKFKRQYIDPHSCNLKMGLECLPFEEKGAIIHKCGCMLVYGPKAVYTNFTDNTGRTKLKCFIPAGLGWDSECSHKSWSNYGYPLPFGDPSGTNAEQAAQTDAFNKGDGEQVIVEYIRWNSIVPQCVPGAECREKGTYTGQRCQCKKGYYLEKPRGICSGAWGVVKGVTWILVVGGVGMMAMLWGNY